MLIFGIATYSNMHVVEYLLVCHCKGGIFAPFFTIHACKR